MTNEELDKIEVRANAATEGPWEFEEGSGYVTANSETICASAHSEDADTAFIAHARQDIPALIAHVRWLEKHLQKALKAGVLLEERSQRLINEIKNLGL